MLSNSCQRDSQGHLALKNHAATQVSCNQDENDNKAVCLAGSAARSPSPWRTPYIALLANGLHPRVLAGPQPARFVRRPPLLLVVEGGLLLDDFDWMNLFDDQRTHRALCHDWVEQKRPKSRVVAIQNANKHFS